MSRRLGLVLAVAAAVIALGLVLQTLAGAPRTLLIAQGVAGVVALGLAAGIAGLGPDSRSRSALIVCILALAALAAPMAFPGLEGIHRWIPLGPLQIQPAAIVLPVIVWFAAGCRETLIGPLAMGLAVLLAALQPDSQIVTGLLAAAIAVFLLGRPSVLWGAIIVLCLVAQIAANFAPTLAPVPYVEQVIRQGFTVGWPLGALALAALAAVALLLGVSHRDHRAPEALVPVALWLGLAAASLSEAYPTPILGFGLSWLLGWGISLGLARR